MVCCATYCILTLVKLFPLYSLKVLGKEKSKDSLAALPYPNQSHSIPHPALFTKQCIAPLYKAIIQLGTITIFINEIFIFEWSINYLVVLFFKKTYAFSNWTKNTVLFYRHTNLIKRLETNFLILWAKKVGPLIKNGQNFIQTDAHKSFYFVR